MGEIFKPSVYKEQVMQKLKDGAKPEDLANQFPLSIRTICRYQNELGGEPKASTPRRYFSNNEEECIIDAIIASPVANRAALKILFRKGLR